MRQKTQLSQAPGPEGAGFVILDGISKRYPGAAQPALQPTTLTIGQGEFFSILGPSGSGKTTTLRTL